MIGVVVPDHDEERLIGGCLSSIHTAAASLPLRGEPVCIVIVADARADSTEAIARGHGGDTLTPLHSAC